MPAGFSAGSAYVDLVPRLQKGWAGSVDKQVDGPLGRIQSKAGVLGKAVALGLGAAVVGGGVALLAIGNKLDDALDNIAIKTGATGDELKGLETSFSNVAKRVPNDLGEVSDAIAAVASRTGLTGKPLEDLSTQLLTLSRITKKDLGTTIEESTRFFGDWGIAVEDQGPSLDKLFAISQKTGVGMSDLQSRLVKFGGPLRQLGFGWEESAALIGKFQKEGVNTDLVMGSLRISLGKMAKAGEDPKKTLARVTDEIKNAGSAGEANAKALELFGARAGPDMAAAIREGRFEVDDLLKSVGNAPDQIAKAAKSTDGFAETWGRLKNKAMIALAPMALAVVSFVDRTLPKLEPVFDWFAAKLPLAIARAKKIIEPIIAGIRQAIGILFQGDFQGGGPFAEDSPFVDQLFTLRDLFLNTILPAAQTFFGWVSRNAKPILIALGVALAVIISPIGAIAAALLFAYTRFSGFRAVVQTVIAWLIANVPPTFEKIRAAAVAAFEWIRTNVLPVVAVIVSTIVSALSSVVAWVQENWPAIQEAIGHVIAFVRGIIDGFVSFALFLWRHFGDELLSVAKTAWDFVRRTVQNGIDFVRSIIETVLALINGDWGAAWEGIKGALGAIWDQMVNLLGTAGELALDALEAVLSLFRIAWDAAWDGMKAVLGGIWDGLTGAAKWALNGLLDLIEKAINSGIGLINTALDGIDKAAGPLVNFGEIPEVDLPELRRKGGPVRPGRDYIVGEDGMELLRMGSTGGHVVSNRKLQEVGGAAGKGGGVTLADGAVQVDARGIQDPETVGDYAARFIGWRLTTNGGR